MYQAPILDLTTAIGIESVFNSGRREFADPWAMDAMPDFVDMCVYANQLRYFAPLKERSQLPEDVGTTGLVRDMQSQSSLPLVPHPYEAYDQTIIEESSFRDWFDRFLSWIETRDSDGSAKRLYFVRRWTLMHEQSWVRDGHGNRIPSVTLFPYEKFSLQSNQYIDGVARRLEIPRAHLMYAFDVAYRYLLYYQKAGRSEYYLSHPLRNSCSIDGLTASSTGRFLVPVSFKHWAETVAPTLTRAEFVDSVIRIRDVVQTSGIPEKVRGEVTVEDVRQMARALKFPPKLNISALTVLGATIGLATTAVGVLANPIVSTIVGLGGVVVGAKVNFWDGRVSGALASVVGLKWAICWPELEEQVEQH